VHTRVLHENMAPPAQGLAVYKKKDGTLSISKDEKSIQWLPLKADGGGATVTIAVADITSRFTRLLRFHWLDILTFFRFAADTRNRCKGNVESF